jgi:predicted  nucleic acid-binding Zn-ribbon protein
MDNDTKNTANLSQKMDDFVNDLGKAKLDLIKFNRTLSDLLQYRVEVEMSIMYLMRVGVNMQSEKTKIISLREFRRIKKMESDMRRNHASVSKKIDEYDDKIYELNKKIDNIQKALNRLIGKVLPFKAN